MFDRLKKALFGSSSDAGSGDGESRLPASQFSTDEASKWASARGLGLVLQPDGQGLALHGQIGGKAWRLEVGRPSRNYIHGEELRARAELGVDESASVLVMSRPLRDLLEKQAFDLYTDTLQTSVDRNLPEEMRWLAIYDEVGWDRLPPHFWQRFAVLSDSRESAVSWIDPALAEMLCEWPEALPHHQVPLVLLIMRGKVYLRMEYSPADFVTVQHATQVFTRACQAAQAAFPAA